MSTPAQNLQPSLYSPKKIPGTVAVYCGSSDGTCAVYLQQAQALGALLGRGGFSLVYGGASIGLMGAVADAALDAGGEVIGVLPHFLEQKEIAHHRLSRFVAVDTMHQRKQKMAEMADAFVALPGGYGTLEELAEILTWAQLGLHSKPVALLNVNGFYNPLLALLDRMVDDGFLRQPHRDLLLCADDPQLLLHQLCAWRPQPVDKISL